MARLRVTAFHQISPRLEIWFGTRGSEVQILSPRPMFLTPYDCLRRLQEIGCGNVWNWIVSTVPCEESRRNGSGTPPVATPHLRRDPQPRAIARRTRCFAESSHRVAGSAFPEEAVELTLGESGYLIGLPVLRLSDSLRPRRSSCRWGPFTARP